jgi:hypothetical protein
MATTGLQPVIPGTGKAFQNEEALRGEFTKAMDPFVKLAQAFTKVEAAASNPSAAGDISLVYGYMKILDPGSTVMQGEQATATNAGGIPERVRAMYNKALTGEGLDSKVRSDFLQQARNLVGSQRDLANDYIERYKEIAKGYQLAPDKIVFDPFKRVKKPEEIIGGATPGSGFFQQFGLIPRPQ